MKTSIETAADNLINSRKELDLKTFKEMSDWVIADGDRNVLEHEHNGQDVNDGADGDGGDSGSNTSFISRVVEQTPELRDKLFEASLTDMLAMRNSILASQ